ncbi:LTA synthase family protein [Aliivibrio fischeri]|uniref:LTA synthase family protein n=1 Tax=Aliivibrio fischeri TaxID=668 RepID=UPI0012D975A7|nr:alkaline phosphatase family protein [Aliivibrio fischeri]MUJ21778.1 sulfatase-like hydrolase/transferase [Aliivibrio fischeri]
MFQKNSKALYPVVWLSLLSFTAILMFGRLNFILQYANFDTLEAIPNDLFNSLFIGFRFDLKVAAIAYAPIFLIGLLTANTRFFSKVLNAFVPYTFIVSFIAISVTTANFFYYQTYGNSFDIFVFGLMEDDTAAVIDILWKDYPILSSAIFSLFVAIASTLLCKKYVHHFLNKAYSTQSTLKCTLVVIANILVYFVIARGSIGTFPLKKYHANVSNYEVLNQATPNAILALNWANSDHKKDAKFHKVSFNEYTSQMEKVLHQSDAKYTTPANPYLEKNPPNVVFALMESMGTNLLLEDGNGTDLLGALRPHMQSDFHFNRFTSGTGGTINSIVMMLFHSNVNSISHSSAQKTPLFGSAFLPYKNAGYDVVYITGGSPNWRNLKYYMPYQGVDAFYDEVDIKKAFPEAEKLSSTWGVPDEFAFKFAEKILAESKKPMMLMIQTETNHPPYKVPENYDVKPIKVSQYAINKMGLDKTESEKIYGTYQYSSNALGEFVDSIKASSLKSKTIISASGDHRLRNYSIEFPKDLGFARAVPFYLYVPDAILEHTSYKFEKERIGSHRDIFPTLYAFSLSNQSYYSLGGRNLLQVNDIENPVAFNGNVTYTKNGVFNNSTPDVIYPWADSASLAIKPTAMVNPDKSIQEDYSYLQTLFLNAQIKGFTE